MVYGGTFHHLGPVIQIPDEVGDLGAKTLLLMSCHVIFDVGFTALSQRDPINFHKKYVLGTNGLAVEKR